MAAVDLGSNSFHMVVARASHGQLVILDRLREMVRLASGLDPQDSLSIESRERALACLRRFGERIRDMDAHQVRVVATNTLRRARNAAEFLDAAEGVLGHPVEVISGIEEARLIYIGVAHHLRSADDRTLVIDIGGGSTELVIGEGYEPRRLESLFMGCVEWSRRFFDDGRLTKKRFGRARLAARLELHPVAASFRRLGWQRAVGSSGTIRATERVARGLGLVDTGITPSALERIIADMIGARRVDELALPELNAERAPVFAGGVAVLVEIMEALEIDSLQIGEGSLREGLLYDTLGRLQQEDARDRTTRAMQRRYHVDEEQADRVRATALILLEQVEKSWELGDETSERFLSWAAQLHEVGLGIAHAKYHEHGGYLLANADLPGFSRLEQQLLSVLVAYHRRKMYVFETGDLPAEWRQSAFRLAVLLRIAVLLNRSRSPVELPEIRLRAGSRSLRVSFPEGWLANNHLTQAGLKQERASLEAVGFRLRVGSFAPGQEASAS